MHRLFVAIRPPAEIRARLIDLMEGVRGARWVDEDQIHITLRFIGEVDRHLANDIAVELGRVRQPWFALSLDGIGSFDRKGQPVTLWAGLHPHEPLRELHKKVDQAVQRSGMEPERRAFHPHITLARLKPGSGPIAPLLEQSGGLKSAPFEVRNFGLYESDLTPAGAIYSLVERYALD